jgi:hypothetical protein
LEKSLTGDEIAPRLAEFAQELDSIFGEIWVFFADHKLEGIEFGCDVLEISLQFLIFDPFGFVLLFEYVVLREFNVLRNVAEGGMCLSTRSAHADTRVRLNGRDELFDNPIASDKDNLLVKGNRDSRNWFGKVL